MRLKPIFHDGKISHRGVNHASVLQVAIFRDHNTASPRAGQLEERATLHLADILVNRERHAVA